MSRPPPPGSRRSPRSGADPSPGSDPRRVALEVIRRVMDEDAYSNLALAGALDRSSLAGRDRALATELAYGTIRRRWPLDRALEGLADRPLADVTPGAMAALRLGAYQLLHTRIPAHAAVAESVSLAPPRARGFVNAVLRRLAAAPLEAPAGDRDEDVAWRTGVVPWAVEELRRLVGSAAEEAAAALGAEAALTLRVNTCRIGVDAAHEALDRAGLMPRRGELVPETLLVEGISPRELPGFREGWFAVQDQASAFVVARALVPETGERVLDACAGPGGKAGHIACLVGPEGLAVAADVSPARARLVAGTAARLGVRVVVVAQDASHPALRGGFDRVLVDAPCSGLGSARRRPELLWRPQRSDLAALSRLQVAVAAASAALVRPGGRLVYSVCTFPRAETDAVCDALLSEHPDLEAVEIEGPGGPAARIRLWPHRDGTDAMFVAAFRREPGGENPRAEGRNEG